MEGFMNDELFYFDVWMHLFKIDSSRLSHSNLIFVYLWSEYINRENKSKKTV